MRVLRTVAMAAFCLLPFNSVFADLALIPGGTDLFGSRYVGGVVDEDSVARSTGLNDFKLFGRWTIRFFQGAVPKNQNRLAAAIGCATHSALETCLFGQVWCSMVD